MFVIVAEDPLGKCFGGSMNKLIVRPSILGMHYARLKQMRQEIRNPRIIKADGIQRLLDDLKSSDGTKSWNAHMDLMQMRAKVTEGGISLLIKALDNKRTRSDAIVALTRLGSQAKKAVDKLIEIARDKKEDRLTRCFAIEALGDIGVAAEKAIPVLYEIWKNESDNLPKPDNKAVPYMESNHRYSAAEAIAKIAKAMKSNTHQSFVGGWQGNI